MTDKKTMYLWLDLETTGLDPEKDQILEVAWILTDNTLVAPTSDDGDPAAGRCLVRPDPSKKPITDLHVMKMHVDSGLIEELLDADPPAGTVRDAQDAILEHVRMYANDVNLVLAGSGVYFDKRFIEQQMPELHQRLSYRIMDVSVVERFFTDLLGFEVEKRPPAHRAWDDVHDAQKRMCDLVDRVSEMRTTIVEQSGIIAEQLLLEELREEAADA